MHIFRYDGIVYKHKVLFECYFNEDLLGHMLVVVDLNEMLGRSCPSSDVDGPAAPGIPGETLLSFVSSNPFPSAFGETVVRYHYF